MTEHQPGSQKAVEELQIFWSLRIGGNIDSSLSYTTLSEDLSPTALESLCQASLFILIQVGLSKDPSISPET
jgi:hypothetical protein